MTTIRTGSSIRFLGKILAACDRIGETEDPDYGGIESKVISDNGRKVTALLRTPSGDAYRVTVEWLSEESP